MAKRAKKNDNELVWAISLSPCPRCKARGGQPCKRREGRDGWIPWHKARIKAGEQQMRKAEEERHGQA